VAFSDTKCRSHEVVMPLLKSFVGIGVLRIENAYLVP
jgi:hypothetical protein